MSDSGATKPEHPPIQAVVADETEASIEQALERFQTRLVQMPEDADPVERVRLQLDIAEALFGLKRNSVAWDVAREAFDAAVSEEAWQEAVEACDILYKTELDDSLVALGNGIWLAVTYPVNPQTTVTLLNHVVDETPDDSDGAAVAAMAAHYIADLRAEGKEKDSLKFLTTQIIAQVAKRHRGIEDQETLEVWIDMLELNDVTKLLPRLAQVVDAIVGDKWWVDRDALRARLPVN